MARPRRLERENTKLKKLVAERALEIEVMEEAAAKDGERTHQTAVDRVCVSTRRGCALRKVARVPEERLAI